MMSTGTVLRCVPFVLWLLLGPTAADAVHAQEAGSELFRFEPASAALDQTARDGRRPRRWRVRPEPVVADQSLLRVPLPDGRVVSVRRTASEALDDEGRLWAGEDGFNATRVRLVTRRGVVVGALEVDGRSYSLGLDAQQHPILEEVEPAQPCPGGRVSSAVPSIIAPAGALALPVAEALGEPTVDLLVVYTTTARIAAGGDVAMRGTVDLAVSAMNEALANSLVSARVRLVDVREVAYQESLSLSIDLDRITSLSDGHLDQVHAWRDAVGADLVSLIVERNGEGFEGLAWLMQQPSTSFASLAFSVVMRRTAASLTLAHEIGHNLGLAHDRANAGSAAVFPYAFGYRDPPHFRDLMSYPCVGLPCPTVPFFSNPAVLYDGRPLGTANSEDSARALRQTIPVAATFRTGGNLLITRVSPSVVSTLGGVRATIEGTRMAAVTRVEIGGIAATSLVLLAPDRLSVVVPRHPQGPVNVTVEDDEGHRMTLAGAVTYAGSVLDSDGDSLDDDWERAMGLNPASGSGADGPDGDPDGDGLSNVRERTEHGHPRGQHQRYFGEGASGTFFTTRLAILNTSAVDAGAVVRYLGSDGMVRSSWLAIPAYTRRTVLADASVSGAEFGIVVESDAPLVVDRTMWWGTEAYGAHAETARLAPASRWFLAEGATTGGFNLFYLLQNPAQTAAQTRIRYLRSTGPPIEKTYVLPPSSRTTIWLNQEDFPGLGRALASAEFSADVEVLAGPAIIVERAMYLDLPGQTFGAGHESAAVASPAMNWFFAEGATGPYFDLFVLIANPTLLPAQIEATYLLPDGTTLLRTYTVPPSSRYTVWVDHEDARLADTAVATTLRSVNGVAVVAERAMWWPGSSPTWHEAHGTAGSTATARRWAVAEGEVGGTRGVDTFVLVANTSAHDGVIRVALCFEDGTRAIRDFDLGSRSRFNVDVRTMFPEASERRFGVVVESVGATPVDLIVEWAQYWDATGQKWAAGTNALATRID